MVIVVNSQIRKRGSEMGYDLVQVTQQASDRASPRSRTRKTGGCQQ